MLSCREEESSLINWEAAESCTRWPRWSTVCREERGLVPLGTCVVCSTQQLGLVGCCPLLADLLSLERESAAASRTGQPPTPHSSCASWRVCLAVAQWRWRSWHLSISKSNYIFYSSRAASIHEPRRLPQSSFQMIIIVTRQSESIISPCSHSLTQSRRSHLKLK